MASSKFSIGISSNLDYEGLTAQIRYNQHYIAEINMDKGKENMEVEIMIPNKTIGVWALPLESFINILKVSKNELLK